MSYHFVKDAFDSKILVQEVYKLYLDEKVNKGEISSLLESNKIDVLYCFTIPEVSNTRFLESLGFNFVSTRIEYILNLHCERYSYKKTFDYSISLFQKQKISQEKLFDLTRVIFQTSRYYKDSILASKQGFEIYKEWIFNSFYRHYADAIYLAFNKSRILVGLVTLKIKAATGIIDLIVVDNRLQGKGIGTALLTASFNYFLKKNIREVTVVTEVENIRSNIFYQKHSFLSSNFKLVYHKHFS